MGRAPRTRRGWTRGRAVLAIAVVLLAIAGVAAVAILQPGRAAPGAATDTVRAIRSDQATTVTLAGTLAPQQRANASFAVGGTVSAVHVRVGQGVDAGAALATLDDRTLRNAVVLADANLAAAKAQLQAVRDADQSTGAQVSAARAQVTALQASADNARQRLEDAVLTAPLSGVVARVSVEVGDQVSGAAASLGSSAGSALGGVSLPGIGGLASGSSSDAGAHVVIVVPDAWQLEGTIGTVDLPSLKPGQLAVVTPTGTNTHVTAVVDTVGIVAEGASGTAATFPVTLKVTQPGVQLFSGADADAIITTETVPDVLTIPAETVQHGTSTTVRRPGGATTDVTVGRRFGDRVEVLAGLVEGDEVLVPQGVVVTPPARPQFGPNGQFVSPGPTASAAR